MTLLLQITGLLGLVLGALWVLQGLGMVEIPPLLCAGDCVPFEGPSRRKAVVGGLAMLAGGALLRAARSSRASGLP
ncbi:MAG: hypothetical protein LCH84_02990 [Gemmatimonadetes bacterium]|nr:hypothetical protein [Gemmatimonadota bacterium]